MFIVPPSVQIYEPKEEEELLRHIEVCGRTAYQTEPGTKPEDVNSFVKSLISKGHLSVLEHESLTVFFVCSRATGNQIVRHRIAAYTQESARFCNYSLGKFGNELCVIRPASIPGVMTGRFSSLQAYKTERTLRFVNSEDPDELFTPELMWVDAMISAEIGYKNLCSLTSPETARGVLPLDLKTTIAATMNIRQWRHVIKQRISLTCSPGMRESMSMLLLEVNGRYPILFSNL